MINPKTAKQKKKIVHKKRVVHDKLLITLIVLIALLIFIFKLPDYVDFIGKAVLLLQTPPQINAGSQLKLDILASGVTDLAGVQVSVGYNSNVLKYDRVVEGNFLNQNGNAQTLFLNTLSTSQAGLVKDIGIVKIGAGVSGDGLIASIYFNATNTGYSDLTIQNVLLSDGSGNPISANILNTIVSVVQPVADTTLPTISLTSPASGATVSGTTTITATASDNVGVSKVEFYVDGNLKSTDTISPYSYAWDTTNVGTHACNGAHTHTLSAKAYDAAGNIGTSLNVPVNMNNPSYCAAISQSPFCSPLPAATGNIVTVSTASQLSNAVANAQSGQTIVVADGTYTISSTLWFNVPQVTLRSQSGNRDGVVIDGNYAVGEIINIRANNVAIADLTLKRAQWHPLHLVSGSNNAMLYNLHIIDAGQQFVKVNPNTAGSYNDFGTLACSLLEMTPAGRTYVESNPSGGYTCYTGGLDAHQAWGWTIRDNTIKNIYCSNGLAEHAIHFWDASRDPIVERNVIINNARGIGFGLGSAAGGRTYSGLSVANANHFGGVIRNNFVYANIAQFDTGIGLESAWNVSVYHNTVYSSGGLPLDVRFTASNPMVKNNLISGQISIRDGAVPTQQGNVQQASSSLFADPSNGNLHLLSTAAAAINKGVSLSGLVPYDIDGQLRDSQPDIGADEYSSAGSLDTTPPVRSNPQPSGTIPAGTASTVLSLTTNEPATCRYSTIPNTPYTLMTNTFTSTGGISHSTAISGLINGNTYTFYVNCIDAAGNANTN
ncbi:hypothetical protein HYW20_09345 [Candidatus Woesearchaeota archaeon]|nr:hypothetical protein [Candidatus Woesearchaeota archaeon]